MRELTPYSQANAHVDGDVLSVPQLQRRPPALPLKQIAATSNSRDAAIVTAYATGAYSYRVIGGYFSIHLSTVGRIVRAGMQR
jgi:putative transposase